VRALRQSERLTEANMALAPLAFTTARALDEVIASDEKKYVVAQLSRAHLSTLEALASLASPESPDVVDQFLAELLTPSANEMADDGRL
jgi:hypothetical protein